MLISEVTRRNIIDEIQVKKLCWYGRLDELVFLKRIFNLKELPSGDSRFIDMEGDIRQHRYNNNDWEDDWVYEDSRLNLIRGDDKIFLNFLCETLHPAVRSDTTEIRELLDIFNNHLGFDNYQLVIKTHISKKPVFHAIQIDEISVSFKNTKKIGRSFVKEQLEKCDTKLAQQDYDGAITNARSLIEDVIARDIHKQITGEEMQTKGDLIKDYNCIKKLLNLVEHKNLDNAFKQVTGGLSSIVNGLSAIGNKMGDRHSQELKPQKHHAKLAINAAKTIVDFLYDVLDYQKTRIEKLRTDMLNLPYIRYGQGDSYYGKCLSLNDREEILQKDKYNEFLEKCDLFTQRLLLNELINNYQINCYNDADQFFILIVLLFEVVNNDDIKVMTQKNKYNNQANGTLVSFLSSVLKIKSSVVPEEVKEFVFEYKKLLNLD